MELDKGSLMFNMNLTRTGNTPPWGTSLGQSKTTEYRFSKDDYCEIITSMVYKKIHDMENLNFILGRPGADQNNYEIVMASLYDKVFVNDIHIEDAKFILVISKELAGVHMGRRTLKYNPTIKYKNFSNDYGYNAIRNKFKIKSNGAWFVTDIYTKNQDELHFKAYFPNTDEPLTFDDGESRKKFMEQYVIKQESISEDGLVEKLKFYVKLYGNDLAEHLFGIKYGNIIEKNGYNKRQIVKKAGLSVPLANEISKGIKIRRHLKEIGFEQEFVEEWNKTKLFTNYKSKYSRNRIVFGAPGTGKSFKIQNECCDLLKGGNEENFERVTFHPDYSYANFVGTYKPIAYTNEYGKNDITYEYVPGPFLRTLVEAMKNIKTNDIKPYLLIIEEINRSNVAAVFGDVFQLLDRNENNVSEYLIETSEDMRKYLARELNEPEDNFRKIGIPDNMFIWATMNSADQGVFPMDTAFKRRWEFEYLGIDQNEEGISERYVILGKGKKERKVEWNKLRKLINKELTSQKINEDKLIGPYFLSNQVIKTNEKGEIDRELFIEKFKNKVLMYLFEDAAKQKRKYLFDLDDENIKYSSICENFDEIGVYIFNTNISNEFERDIVEEETNDI